MPLEIPGVGAGLWTLSHTSIALEQYTNLVIVTTLHCVKKVITKDGTNSHAYKISGAGELREAESRFVAGRG